MVRSGYRFPTGKSIHQCAGCNLYFQFLSSHRDRSSNALCRSGNVISMISNETSSIEFRRNNFTEIQSTNQIHITNDSLLDNTIAQQRINNASTLHQQPRIQPTTNLLTNNSFDTHFTNQNDDDNNFQIDYPSADESHDTSTENENEFIDLLESSFKMAVAQNNPSFNIEQLLGLQLHHVVSKANAPLYLYDKILKVVSNISYESKRLSIPLQLPSRSDLIQSMNAVPINDLSSETKNLPHHLSMKPTMKEVKLLGTEIVVQVPTFSVKAILTSFFQDPILMD